MQRHFYYSILCWVLLALPASGQSSNSQLSPKTIGGYLFLSPNCGLPAHINIINMLHSDVDSLPIGTKVYPGMVVAHVQPLPAIRSIYYGSALTASEAAYNEGQFADAATLLTEAVEHEPNNLFLLNAYARALYQVNETKPQSYAAYQAFFKAQKAEYAPANNELAVDSWFLESYWKFGTLCLDTEQWSQAVASIEQFLAGYDRMNAPNPQLLEQALSYLTEAFFQLHKVELCRYYGQRTLKLYPANQYVKRYLAALPKATPRSHR
jgi:tetratricopeptide (TPR) repeat protein